MTYQRKTRDVWYLQGKYEGKWETLFECEDGKDAREQLACYRENEPRTLHRIIKVREKLNQSLTF